MRGYVAMKYIRVVLAGLAVTILTAHSALADMGKAPVNEGTYGSIEGGFLHQNADDIIGYGTGLPPGTIVDVTVDPDNGWFIGGMIGFAGTSPFIAGLPFTRIELYGLYGRTDDDVSATSPPLAGISLKNVDATILVNGGASGTTSSERRTVEAGLRFEGEDQAGGNATWTWVAAPFIRWMNEETDTLVVQCCGLRNNSDVDTTMYGIYVAAEPEIWLSNAVAFVGRVGVGIYGYSADGDFRSSDNLNGFFAAGFSDDDSGVGFRGLLGAGFKFKLSSNANLETFAEADYFSDVGTAAMANNQPGDGTPSHTDTSDLWELRAGARVTIGFGQ